MDIIWAFAVLTKACKPIVILRNRLDPDQHNTFSPLEVLPIDFINDFPIANFLHSIDLGIMKNVSFVGFTEDSPVDQSYVPEPYIIFMLLHRANKSIPVQIHRAVG